jgi:hypothetical protein
MIAQTPGNSWSELLTSILQPKQMPDARNAGTECSCCSVSNPAQNRVLQPAIISLPEMRNAKRSSITPGVYPSGRNSSRPMGEKIEGGIHGNRPSSVPQSAPQTAGPHHGVVREAAGDPYTASCRNPNTKGVPILRVNYATVQTIVFGVWEVSQSNSTRAERCKARMNNPEQYCDRVGSERSHMTFLASPRPDAKKVKFEYLPW